MYIVQLYVYYTVAITKDYTPRGSGSARAQTHPAGTLIAHASYCACQPLRLVPHPECSFEPAALITGYTYSIGAIDRVD